MQFNAQRILLVPDKFKGSLTAAEAAAAIAEGWRQVRPQDVIETQLLADGGDGFGPVFAGLLGAAPQIVNTVDCTGQACEARWWLSSDGSTAIIEAAEVNGLARLPAGQGHPFQRDTYGLGALLQAAAAAGVRRCLVGIGGSATNDGGFGLARALGWRFVDATGRQIKSWALLDQLSAIQAPAAALAIAELVVAVDVSNPLLGPQGATAVYGPQKGLAVGDLPQAERCLRRLAVVCDRALGQPLSELPGAGAAGGLGYGLRVFCGGRFQSGGALFMQLAKLPERMASADLVITAEGALDEQSLMGKGVGLLAAEAARLNKPCWCLSALSTVQVAPSPWPGFRSLAIVPQLASAERSQQYPHECLVALAAFAAEQL